MARPTEGTLVPIFLRDVDLWAVTAPGTGSPVTSKNFKQAATGVTLTPATTTTTLQTLSPLGSFTSVGNPTWSCVIAYLQDWESDDSLANFLLDQQGVPASLYFTPAAGRGKSWKIDTPALLPGPIGGAGVNSGLAATVTLGVNGRPQRMTQAQLATAFPAS